jgi:hypothetical protein
MDKLQQRAGRGQASGDVKVLLQTRIWRGYGGNFASGRCAFLSKESVMAMKARRMLVPALAAVAGICLATTTVWSQSSGGYFSPGAQPNSIKAFAHPGLVQDLEAGPNGSMDKKPPAANVPAPGPGLEGDGVTPPGFPGPAPCPRELTPTSLPPYTIAPPDILYLDAMRLIPKPPYRIEPLEV